MAWHNYDFFWHNPPQEWSFSHETLVLHADPKTDFWRKTHYGFVRDNGHFWYVNEKGDFEATVKLVAEYRDQYDQAGLMVRLDNKNSLCRWIIRRSTEASIYVLEWKIKCPCSIRDDLPRLL
jgi:regulation of enolase protein 1 (concanavalin A-like superfamily)